MSEPVDLFGDSIIRRSADFIGGHRIALHRNWSDGPMGCVIGHNPSEADGCRDDPTSKWWNRWFNHWGFGGYSAYNLYPFVTPDPRECYRIVSDIHAGNDFGSRDALHFINLPKVTAAAKAASKVFVCWGNIARDHDWIEHVVEEIQNGEGEAVDLWCWGKTKSGAPTHPMARGKHRIDPLVKATVWRSA